MNRAVVEQCSSPDYRSGGGGANPTPRLQSRDWWVSRIEHKAAAAMMRWEHYTKGAPNTATYAFGLERRGDVWQLYGASIWIPPTRRAAEKIAGDDWQGVLACSRLVCTPDAPKNAASFLLAHSRRQIDRDRWPVLVSYADTRLGHTGAIYLADGWTCDGETPAGDVWIDPNGRQMGRKRGGFTFTADQMRALGFVRAPNMPKLRFVHRASTEPEETQP